MKLTDLELFDIVAREESFIKASKCLHFSQSAVSQHIKKMEAELGFPLFERDRHSVSLTPQGKILLEAAQEILSRYKQALEDCQKQSQKAQVLTLSYVGSSTFSFLHTLVKNYHALHPSVEICTRRIRPDKVIQMLEGGECNLVFTPYDLVSSCPQVSFHPLYEDALYAVMNREHPLALRKKLSYPDLAGMNILAPSKEFCPDHMQKIVEKLSQEEMHCHIHNGYNIDNVTIQLLSHGNYIAVMPGHTVPENPKLLAIPFEGEAKVTVGFAYYRALSEEEKSLLSLAGTSETRDE